MKQLSLKVLQKVAEELNDFLDITPRISTKSSDEELREKILEAAGLLVVDGKVNEMLELSKTTQKVISVLQTHVDMEVPDVSYSNMKVSNTSAENEIIASAKEKPAPKKDKPTVKKEKGVSNKSIVWDIFTKQGITEKEQITESFVESTAAQVPDVQKTTVKGWMRSWVDGKNMPACAKK